MYNDLLIIFFFLDFLVDLVLFKILQTHCLPFCGFQISKVHQIHFAECTHSNHGFNLNTYLFLSVIHIDSVLVTNVNSRC